MGKKNKQELDKLKDKFIGQATAKGYELSKLEKRFGTVGSLCSKYAFNKSHFYLLCSRCLSNGLFKEANYAAEYMTLF